MSLNRCFPLLLISLFLIDTGDNQNVTPINETKVSINDDTNHTWTSINFPNPYPIENQTLIIKVQYGYSIIVVVEELDLDSSKGDFLLIKGGEIWKDENKGIVLTYNLKSKKTYFIDNTSAYLAFCVRSKNVGTNKGFSLTYRRIGAEIKTTEAPPTTISWPTPSEGDRMYLTINVTGKSQEDFANSTILNNFKNTIASMATEYCSNQNISLSQNITIQNIHISILTRCSYNWPESEICVKIQLSIPVFLAENSSLTGYQLSSEHLEHMWRLLADKWLPYSALSIYQVPDSNSKLLMWFTISCIILVVLAVGLLIVKNFSKHTITSTLYKKRRRSDTDGIVKNEVKAREMSLAPHPLQVIPPFFDNESFHQYEPKIDEPSKEENFLSDDSEDEITISHFSNSKNFISENKNIESNT